MEQTGITAEIICEETRKGRENVGTFNKPENIERLGEITYKLFVDNLPLNNEDVIFLLELSNQNIKSIEFLEGKVDSLIAQNMAKLFNVPNFKYDPTQPLNTISGMKERVGMYPQQMIDDILNKIRPKNPFIHKPLEVLA